MATSESQGQRETGWLEREGILAWRILGIGLVIAAVVYLALRIQFIVMAAVLGFAIVSLLWPLAKWLRAHKVPAIVASLVSVLLFLGFFASIIVFVVSEVINSWDDMVESVTGSVDEVNEWLASGPFGLDTETVQGWLDDIQSQLGNLLGEVSQAATTGITLVGNFATVLLIAIFFTIFALTSGDKLWAQFVSALRPEYQAPAHVAFKGAMKATGNWFYASTVTGLVDGFFIGLGLTILNVALAIPIGALTFMLGYIPLVGATLAGGFAITVAFVSGGLTTAIWALLIVLAVQQIEGNVLSPLLMSRAVSFHPLITLLLTTGAGVAFGLVGLFLAVPVVGAITAAVIGWRRKVREQEHRAGEDADAEERQVMMPGADVPHVDDDEDDTLTLREGHRRWIRTGKSDHDHEQ
ncbi:AI-2E family transporter [Phytoactinopolyspora halotolerans]|uniref:AI-2E family transporter n=1 Tax=Phytoactinopolyspora halotolerans TaxID=1981512 RepID=A0A6L9S883_9ACTN|nr:AI-2E family transporter [Phytoactinopolyspora halotolerans]NEE01406.1 AI-2E family transporter [Phytoactinopolyspora halotolerans]